MGKEKREERLGLGSGCRPGAEDAVLQRRGFVALLRRRRSAAAAAAAASGHGGRVEALGARALQAKTKAGPLGPTKIIRSGRSTSF